MTFNRETSEGSDSADPSLTPLTARFRDPELENAFQDTQLYQVRRIMVGFAVVGLFGAILSGYGTYLEFGANSWIFQGGLWLRLPLVFLVAAIIPIFLTLRNRNWLYAWHTLLLVWGCTSIALRMTTPYDGDDTLLALFHVSRDGVLLLLIVSLYVLALIPGWFLANVIIMTLALAGFFTLAGLDAKGPASLSKLALVSTAAYAFILVIANAARRLWRQTYVAHMHLRTANQKLEQLAQTDELTGCANRRHFFNQGNLEFDKAMRYNSPLSVVAIDIDHFKSVNDRYGHASGDRVLEAFAALLRRDLRETDLPARIGGEEFVILLPGTDGASALLLAERLRGEIEHSPVETEMGPVSVNASFGVADVASAGVTDFDSMTSVADTALYQAKETGRNRVVEATAEVLEAQAAHSSHVRGPE